jgi:hypothetical protein
MDITPDDLHRQVVRWAHEIVGAFPAGAQFDSGFRHGRGEIRVIWQADVAKPDSSIAGKVSIVISDQAIFEYLRREDADEDRLLADEWLRKTLEQHLETYDYTRDGDVTWSILSKDLNARR